MKLYGCAYDSIWEITGISFTPTLFGKFSVVIDMTNHFTSEEASSEFQSDDYQYHYLILKINFRSIFYDTYYRFIHIH